MRRRSGWLSVLLMTSIWRMRANDLAEKERVFKAGGLAEVDVVRARRGVKALEQKLSLDKVERGTNPIKPRKHPQDRAAAIGPDDDQCPL